MSFENLKDKQLKALKESEGYVDACGLIDKIEENGFEAYLVGGCVRDVLLDRKLKDFDMCTSAKPEDMKRIFKDYKLLLQGEAFGTVSVVVDKTAYEITSFRGDGVYSDSRHPDSVEFKNSLKDDLERRDFTVNALAYHPIKGVVDLVGGFKDLKLKILRTVGDPDKRFDEDALRIARLIRFAVQLGFEIEDKTLEAAFGKAHHLKNISTERIYTEFKKMLNGEPHLEVLDHVFGASFHTELERAAELDLFEKAYVSLEISERLGVSVESYVLEKNLREGCLALIRLKNTETLKTDFIQLCDKFSLYGEDQLSLWSVVCLVNSEAAGMNVQPYSKPDISIATQELRLKHEGRALGQVIFDLKITLFFTDLV